MARYTEEFKDVIIAKVLAPETKSIRAVAKDYDLPIGTVLNWLNKRGIDVNLKHNEEQEESKIDSTTDPSLLEKFKILLEANNLSEEELSAYCRNKGIYTHDVNIWKEELLSNLDSRNKKKLDKENNKLKVQVRELQSELRCKDKALAETSALLLLKKKHALFGRITRKKNNKR